MGSCLGWFNPPPFSPGILERLDALFADGGPPFLAVFPDGWTSLGGSQWMDSPGNGHYGRMVVRDVLGHVERSYRTVPGPAARAVAGRSSGRHAGGALARHSSGVFGPPVSHSAGA